MPKDFMTAQTIGLKGIQQDLLRDKRSMARYKERGHKKSCLAVIRQTKKEYLRKSSSMGNTRSTRSFGARYNTTRLGRKSGLLASSMTYRYFPSQNFSKIGWWRIKYASVVAEPPPGQGDTTTIKPKKKRLMFPLTKKALNAWHMVKPPWVWKANKAGKTYLVVGGRNLYLYEDFTFAKRVVITARRPASRALFDLRNTIPGIMLREFPILEPGAR